MRKPLIILSIILAVIGLGGGTYYAWVTSQKILNSPSGEGKLNTNDNLPNTQTSAVSEAQLKSKLKIVGDRAIAGYWISQSVSKTSSTSSIFYVTEEGDIYQSFLDREEDASVTKGSFSPVRSVQGSPDGSVALIESGESGNSRFALFTVATGITYELPSAQSAAFSPDGKRVAYLDSKGDVMARDLFGARPKTVKLFSLPLYDVKMHWVSANTFAFLSRPSSRYFGELWEYALGTKSLRLLDSGLGLMNTWSADGKYQLRFKTDSARNAKMQFIDERSVARANISASLPEKCAFRAPQIYCAIAQDFLPSKPPVLPDDYLMRASYSRDTFYVIDPTGEQANILFESSEPFIDAVSLRILGNNLFFINRFDNKLYSLEL